MNLSLDAFLDLIDRMTGVNSEDVRNGYRDGFNGTVGEGQKSLAYWRSHRNGSEAKAKGAHQPRLDESA